MPNPASLTEAYAAFWEEVAKWDSDDYFTDEQLETAKTQLAISDAFDKEKHLNIFIQFPIGGRVPIFHTIQVM